MAEYFYFNSRDELLRIAKAKIVYLEAVGNYTVVILENGFRGTVGVSLSRMEKMLAVTSEGKSVKFARVGKSHIINLSHILSINPLKQELVLSDQSTFSYSLDISKDALRKLKDILMESRKNKQTNQ